MLKSLFGSKKPVQPARSENYKRVIAILSDLVGENMDEVEIESQHGGRIIHINIRLEAEYMRKVKAQLQEINENYTLPKELRRDITPLPPVKRISFYHSLSTSAPDVLEKVTYGENGKTETVFEARFCPEECGILENKFRGILALVAQQVERKQTQRKINKIMDSSLELRTLFKIQG